MNVPRPMPVLWLNGPEGIGKSTVGFVIFRQLRDAGTTTAYVDLDQASWFRPAPEDDPDNHRVKVRNLAKLWSVYEHAGHGASSRRATSATVRSWTPTRLQSHRPMDVCQLHAGASTLGERLLARGRGGGPLPADELRGQSVAMLSRLAAEAAASAHDPEREAIGDVHVVTDHRTVEEVAIVVREELGGWPKITD